MSTSINRTPPNLQVGVLASPDTQPVPYCMPLRLELQLGADICTVYLTSRTNNEFVQEMQRAGVVIASPLRCHRDTTVLVRATVRSSPL